MQLRTCRREALPGRRSPKPPARQPARPAPEAAMPRAALSLLLLPLLGLSTTAAVATRFKITDMFSLWERVKDGGKNTSSFERKTYMWSISVLLTHHLRVTTRLENDLCLCGTDCPSSTWIQFQDSCYIFLKEAIKVESIEDLRNQCTGHGADMVSIHTEEENAFLLDTLKNQWKGPEDVLLGMFYDTDDASFKWFDNSNMTFDKWAEEEEGEDLVDTCGFLYTKTGEWKKGNCEISSVEGTLCKAAIPYLSDNHILITTSVIAITVILIVLGAILWFFYKRNSGSGFTTVFATAPQSPYNDDCVLVVAEENW